MSTGTRVPLAVAVTVALEIGGQLAPAAEHVEIAGSVRRRRPDVGDIEFVVVPRIDTVKDGMFDQVGVNRLTERIDNLIGAGILAPHPDDPKRGERYSKVIDPDSGLQVDIFSATPQTYGLILLIRTGPADYSHRFVTDLRRAGLHAKGGELHRGGLGCGSYACEVVPTPSEESVYSAAGWAFVKPEGRE